MYITLDVQVGDCCLLVKVRKRHAHCTRFYDVAAMHPGQLYKLVQILKSHTCTGYPHSTPRHVPMLNPAERWADAHTLRQELLDYLTRVSGVGTLLDSRRFVDYDAEKAVDRYLNLPHVQVSTGQSRNTS